MKSRRGFLRELAAAAASALPAPDATADAGPAVATRPLTAAERARYEVQLALPDWSESAQLALAEASVLVVGAGALGSPAALYLAGAGVGRLGVLDDGAVTPSDMQRQPLHYTPDVGDPKAESAAAKLRYVNPDVIVEPYQARFGADNGAALVEGQDLVVDCSGSAATSYAVNAACCGAGVPLSVGAVTALVGVVMTIRPGRTACYRCAFPLGSDGGVSGAGGMGGALGPVAGVIGSLQALEAIRLLAGLPGGLGSEMARFDLVSLESHKAALARREDCSDCGPAVTMTG